MFETPWSLSSLSLVLQGPLCVSKALDWLQMPYVDFQQRLNSYFAKNLGSYFHSSSTFSFCLLLVCLISFSDVAFFPWENQLLPIIGKRPKQAEKLSNTDYDFVW